MFKRSHKEDHQPEERPRGPEPAVEAPTSLTGALLGVHTARNPGWLADASSTAAERGLGALYSILYLIDSSELLAGQRPTSSERVRSLGRLNEALGVDLTTLRFRSTDRPALSNALLDGQAGSVSDLAEAIPLGDETPELREAQRRLGIAEVWLAPLFWDGQGTGVLLLFMPANTSSTLAEAELLGRHAAVAHASMLAIETSRHWGELDTVRWVYDEQRFLSEMRAEIRRAERHMRPLSVLFLRIQNLPELRSRYGKFLTEGLLRQLGSKFAEAIRDTDFLGAYREDGFATILVEANQNGAQIARERLLSSLDSINLAEAELPDLKLRLACATATLMLDGSNAEELIAAAELRLAQDDDTQTKVA
jgi:diguanylate cyclase (GGDEF)-like protein